MKWFSVYPVHLFPFVIQGPFSSVFHVFECILAPPSQRYTIYVKNGKTLETPQYNKYFHYLKNVFLHNFKRQVESPKSISKFINK